MDVLENSQRGFFKKKLSLDWLEKQQPQDQQNQESNQNPWLKTNSPTKILSRQLFNGTYRIIYSQITPLILNKLSNFLCVIIDYKEGSFSYLHHVDN